MPFIAWPDFHGEAVDNCVDRNVHLKGINMGFSASRAGPDNYSSWTVLKQHTKQQFFRTAYTWICVVCYRLPSVSLVEVTSRAVHTFETRYIWKFKLL